MSTSVFVCVCVCVSVSVCVCMCLCVCVRLSACLSVSVHMHQWLLGLTSHEPLALSRYVTPKLHVSHSRFEVGVGAVTSNSSAVQCVTTLHSGRFS